MYALYSRCFKLSVSNAYHCLNEFTIALFNVVLFVSYIKGITYQSERLAEVCIYLITVTWVMNIGFSLIKTGIGFYEKFKACRKKKKNLDNTVHKIHPLGKQSKTEEVL